MAKDRLAPCIYYVCKGSCTKGKDASQTGTCKTCSKYMPRKGFKKINKKRAKKNNEFYD